MTSMGSQPSKKPYRPAGSGVPDAETSHRAALEMDKCAFVALHDFPLGDQADLAIRIGERVTFVSEDGDWWKVASISTGKECYVPKKYLARVFNRWLYKGVNREKAEALLLLSSNKNGSFLIRESESRKGCFSLSIRRTNQALWDSVKHYRINTLENGWFYISPRLTFPTLQDLVDYYSEADDGICCILKEPCALLQVSGPIVYSPAEPVMVRNPTLNWNDLDSAALFREDTSVNDDCPVSLGLRQAVSSYMFMTEEFNSKSTTDREHLWRTY
ncbi:src-like-adapter 2 [Spea bombifrons]|uniref:src-like-adapter 2 n=1 Tax=Spea bombifrons TaxID=233779 RepID=UPI002349972E|nr:src-like-adapter 2 [Spea bombifrons]